MRKTKGVFHPVGAVGGDVLREGATMTGMRGLALPELHVRRWSHRVGDRVAARVAA